MYSPVNFQTSAGSLIPLSQHIINLLYGETPLSISSWLDSDIVWVDTTLSQCLYGYYPVLTSLSRKTRGERYHALHMQYHTRNQSDHLAIITGKYKTIQKTAERISTCQMYHISLVWDTSLAPEDKPRLIHVHISSAANQPRTEVSLCFHGKRAEVYRLLPEEILYIEAENTSSILYVANGSYPVCQSIGQMETQLPPQFLRVHRSFIVNMHYVSRVYRYGIELSNHTTVPVPEKKYMRVVCEIEQYQR